MATLDQDSNSVLATALDVKTNASWAHPVTVKYRMLGVPTAVNVNDGRVWIDCDSANEAHQFLYGTDTLVRTLGDLTDYESEAPTALGTNQFQVKWDGRDDRTNRLLLGGTFRVSASFTLSGYGDLVCRSSNVLQQIAQPHAGHFCGDWPRSSVYSNSAVPAGGSLTFYGNTNNVDENPSDSIYPTLKAAYYLDSDGFWSRLQMKFEWLDEDLKGWVVYTPTSLYPGLAKGHDGSTLTGETDIHMQILDIQHYNNYPTQRRALTARYNGTDDYDIYCNTNFWCTNFVSTGQDIGSFGDKTQWVAYDGTSGSDVKLGLDPGDFTPQLNSELAVMFFPPLGSVNGLYNMGGGYSNGLPSNIVQVALSGFSGNDGDNFTLYIQYGYGFRKFWSYPVGNTTAGVDIDGAITAANGYDSVSYASPRDTNDYGNLTKEQAMAAWTNTAGLLEISTHGANGWLGWYQRVYEPGDDTNSVDELFDPAHTNAIYAAEITNSFDLDDVNLAILVGCHTADTNGNGDSMVSAFAQAGTDIVIGWTDLQNPNTVLFAKYFLERAFQKDDGANSLELGIDVSWTNYPKVWEMRDAAFVDLFKALGDNTNAAMYVYANCSIGGSKGANNALNMKVYPPRYGAKDRED